MNPKTIVGVVLAIVLIVAVVKFMDRRDNEVNINTGRETDIEDSLEDAGDNLREAADDAGRKLEDAVD